MQLINNKLKLFSFFLIGLFFVTNAYAQKFPEGYPECWQDPENPINQNFVTSDVNKNNLGQAIEFFRIKKNMQNNTYHHVGIYSYTQESLSQFISLPKSKNENLLNKRLFEEFGKACFDYHIKRIK